LSVEVLTVDTELTPEILSQVRSSQSGLKTRGEFTVGQRVYLFKRRNLMSFDRSFGTARISFA
jgi:hypothetical protein